jgi:hypothetical protein
MERTPIILHDRSLCPLLKLGKLRFANLIVVMRRGFISDSKTSHGSWRLSVCTERTGQSLHELQFGNFQIGRMEVCILHISSTFRFFALVSRFEEHSSCPLVACYWTFGSDFAHTQNAPGTLSMNFGSGNYASLSLAVFSGFKIGRTLMLPRNVHFPQRTQDSLHWSSV